MGFGLCSIHRDVLLKTRQFSVTALAFLVAFSPMRASAGQGTAQNSAGGANSMAQGISAAMGVVSMGLGGLYMAKGAQQLSCCSSGCTGNGAASQTANQNLNNAAKDEATKIKLKLDLELRYPDGAWICPQPRGGIFSLMEFFQPPKAEAGIGGCVDAMIALATGGLMMLQGLMSLNAANQAGKNADSAYANANGMGSYPGANGTSPTAESLNGKKDSSALGVGGRSGELVKIDPSLLRTGKANDIMGQFENKFGIGRDQFAKAILSGEDPRKIFGTAPRNALSNADLNKATTAAKGMSDADKANALAATDLDAAQKEMAGTIEQYAVNTGGGKASSGLVSASRGLAQKASEDLEALDVLNQVADTNIALSPEVKAALSQKALSDRAAGIHDLTLFQVVHNKLREKSKMIFGYDPDGVPKGVGNADGI